jgi:hypothetical protein
MSNTSHFTFEKIQIKSIEKARLFAHLYDQMEKEFGIKTSKITLKDCFICSDISDEELNTLTTPAEKNIKSIIYQLR